MLEDIDLDVTPLHKVLLEMLSGKKFFVLNTNADMAESIRDIAEKLGK
ncbi:hypothetical protein JCM37173_27720 [Allocoprococcus similis]